MRASSAIGCVDRKLSFINDVVVLHYSDKYNNAAGYDAITATTKSEQYREMLRDALLSDTGLQEVLEDTSRLNDVIQLFNAVNGEWLLDMVSSPTNQRKGTIGVISAIKLLLATMADDDTFTWVPVSIEEIVRVSGAIGLSSKDSPFSARNMGFVGTEFSDDVLMIGVGCRDAGVEMAFHVRSVVVVKGNELRDQVVEILRGRRCQRPPQLIHEPMLSRHRIAGC